MAFNLSEEVGLRHSIVSKIFVVCFVCIHVPLIALVLNYGTGRGSDAWSVGLVVLVATLIGTIACLATMWWLTLPLRNLARVISRYREGGAFAEEQLNKHGVDEIAVVSRAVCGMVSEITALAERADGQPGLDPLTGLLNGSAVHRLQLERPPKPTENGLNIMVALFELQASEALGGSQMRDITDLALVAVGDLVRRHFLPRQIAARVSGTTFVLLFSGDPPDVVLACCDAIRQSVAALEIGPLAAGSLRVTFGLAQRQASEPMADLLHKADMALFRAKDMNRTGLETLKA
ncbi:diguanylate cyclase [Rhizobium sp. AQ_MP]|uniref:GGDEF domain-containing protein n=1 Tax=Rhizobium sp. AQ_MP TaxID=2761536 RepID=UPI001639D4FB|nr:diguanylate cyclase [Rhizobium sp. AQ_MP]MBC2773208.1 diguanylate cyclase [Rhizobium sp. AQ_MP]